MQEIGDIVRGKQIGKKDKSRKFIFSKCEKCGEMRWVICKNDKPLYKFCQKCSVLFGENHPLWKGGKHTDKDGYIRINLEKGKREFEHRLVAQNILGRKLKKNEIVHHIDWDKHNNVPENLFVCNPSFHKKMCGDLLKLTGELYKSGIIRFKDGKYFIDWSDVKSIIERHLGDLQNITNCDSRWS
jgi:hypothetical protein